MSDPIDFNIDNWYWKVGDTNPTTHVYATISESYVLQSNATYLAWVASGGAASVIGTQAELYQLFDNVARSYGRAPRLVAGAGAGTTYTVPALSATYLELNCDNVVMPRANVHKSYGLCIPITIQVFSSAASVNIYAQDGVTVIATLTTVIGYGVVVLFQTRNDTANGTFTPFYPVSSQIGVGFRANLNGVSQTGLVSLTETKIAFTTEVFDNGNFYDAPNAKWVPPTGLVALQVKFQGSATNVAGSLSQAIIYKNGVELCRSRFAATVANDTVEPSVWVVDYANGSDYYEAYARIETTAGTGTVVGTVTRSFFCGAVIGH